MASLKRREFKVAPFKVGPDFIDPGYHKQICGSISRNLDGWMLSREYNIKTFARHAKKSDIAIVEGVMGLYDGYDGRSESGSTAQMAKLLKLPVLLVVDAASMARSAAAIVLGFERFDPDVNFLGVIFNRTGSPRHLQYLKDALYDISTIPCLGGFTRNSELTIKERHLGLVINEENHLSDDYIQALADSIDASIDMDLLLSHLCETEIQEKATLRHEKDNNRPLIGIARDEAFCFYYQDNLDLLEKYGARLVYFSPLKDKHLPDGLDGLYIGGGYPELHAEKISGNITIKKEIYEHAQNGLPVYAECGGLVYLSSLFENDKNISYPMVGLFPFNIRLLPRIKSLGYREIKLASLCILGSPGDIIRGHEFHYSELSQQDEYNDMAYQIINLKGEELQKEGFIFKNTLMSYIHLHFGSNIKVAENFVNFCYDWSKKKD